MFKSHSRMFNVVNMEAGLAASMGFPNSLKSRHRSRFRE